MYCYNCGKEIDDNAVVCVHCGVATKNMNDINKNLIINNNASSSASSSASASNNNSYIRRKKKYNLFLDIILIFCTGGLWLLWMLIRPKYEY